MKKSEDVTKLFSLFGKENSGQYQEIYKSEQNNASRERWPMFQRVHIDSDVEGVPPRATNTITRPNPKPVHIDPPAIEANDSPAAAAQKKPVATTDTQQAPEARIMSFLNEQLTSGSVQKKDSFFADPAPSTETRNSLKEMFKRLERSSEVPAIIESPAPEPSESAKTSRSIRSLFSRISRQ